MNNTIDCTVNTIRITHIVGDNIKQLRKQHGLTQEDLAVIMGSHREYISRIELGKENITLQSLENIAQALSTKASTLLID